MLADDLLENGPGVMFDEASVSARAAQSNRDATILVDDAANAFAVNTIAGVTETLGLSGKRVDFIIASQVDAAQTYASL